MKREEWLLLGALGISAIIIYLYLQQKKRIGANVTGMTIQQV